MPKHPASSRASSQPILKQTRNRKPRVAQRLVMVTQPGGGRGGIRTWGFLEPGLLRFQLSAVTSDSVSLGLVWKSRLYPALLWSDRQPGSVHLCMYPKAPFASLKKMHKTLLIKLGEGGSRCNIREEAGCRKGRREPCDDGVQKHLRR